MIQHVWERVRRAKDVSGVLVATDDERILRAVKEFDGHAVMTRSDHRSGTERVAEVAASSAGRDAEIIVNVQGEDRKSTRLNSSHRCISYAVFCLKKKKKNNTNK